MKVYPEYQGIILHSNSQAYFLYELWKKFGKPEDKKKLDLHMKQLDQNLKDLLARYK